MVRWKAEVMFRGQVNCHIPSKDCHPLCGRAVLCKLLRLSPTHWMRQSQTRLELSVFSQYHLGFRKELLWRDATCLSYCLYFTCYLGNQVLLWLWCHIGYTFQNWKFLKLSAACSLARTLIFDQTNDFNIEPVLTFSFSRWLIMGGENSFKKTRGR